MAETPYRVLIVDDENDIRMIVGMNVSLAGMEFAEAGDGRSAIEKLHSEQWDGIVLDLAMPEVDGFMVLRDMHDQGLTEKMGVVVLSAKAHPATAIEAMELGAHVHIAKPFSPSAVAETIKELVELTPDERTARRNDMMKRAGSLERLGMETI